MQKEKKRKVKLPLGAYLLYLVVASFLLTGVTFSRYITSSSGGDGARVIAMGGLTLTESGDFDDQQGFIIPGVDMTKNAEVDFAGCEAATYVFVEITVSTHWTRNEKTFTVGDGLLSWEVAADWTHLTSADGSHVYYRALEPNEKLAGAEIIANGGRITVSPNITAGVLEGWNDIQIDLQATVVQAHGFADANAAWIAVSQS